MPAEANGMFVCHGGRTVKVILGVFTTREKADTYAKRADAWYGSDHPLTPISVEPVKVDIQPFPEWPAADEDDEADALTERLLDEDAESRVAEIFATIDQPEPFPKTGGRR